MRDSNGVPWYAGRIILVVWVPYIIYQLILQTNGTVGSIDEIALEILNGDLFLGFMIAFIITSFILLTAYLEKIVLFPDMDTGFLITRTRNISSLAFIVYFLISSILKWTSVAVILLRKSIFPLLTLLVLYHVLRSLQGSESYDKSDSTNVTHENELSQEERSKYK